MGQFDSYPHLDCRDLGHAWAVEGVVVTQSAPLRYKRILRCMRCGTARKNDYTVNGRTMTRNYGYPGDYLMDEPLTKRDREALRLTSIKRQLRRSRLKRPRLRKVAG